jgi:hypothetical protein
MVSLAWAASASQNPPEYVTVADMERYFLTKGLSFGAAFLGGIWIIYGALERARDKKDEVIERERERKEELKEAKERERWDNINKAIEIMAGSVSALAATLKEHNEDAGAHYQASRANHAPLEEVLHELRQGISDLKQGQQETRLSVAALVAEHNVIRENECSILRLRTERTRKDDPPGVDSKELGRSEG